MAQQQTWPNYFSFHLPRLCLHTCMQGTTPKIAISFSESERGWRAVMTHENTKLGLTLWVDLREKKYSKKYMTPLMSVKYCTLKRSTHQAHFFEPMLYCLKWFIFCIVSCLHFLCNNTNLFMIIQYNFASHHTWKNTFF